MPLKNRLLFYISDLKYRTMKYRFLHIFLLSFLLLNGFVVQHHFTDHDDDSCAICFHAGSQDSALPNEIDHYSLSLPQSCLLIDCHNHLITFQFNPLIEPIRGSPSILFV